MCAGQRKGRLRIVIEYPVLPVARIVTGCTVAAQCTVMLVLFGMARDAFHPGIFEACGGMTTCARNGGVLADQRKRRKFVIETDGDFPSVLGVTLLAAGT